MHRWLSLLLICLAAPLASPVGAHPHIFIETRLELRVDDAGQLTGVEVTWIYDELYSLLVLEDYELDSDYDGILTDAEREQLTGFDMQWMEGYEGDLYVTRAGEKVTLKDPVPLETGFADGQIYSVHLRPVDPIPARDLLIKVYDPTFYTAYDLAGGVHVPGGCSVAIGKADLDAAYALVEQELGGRDVDIEDYPAVGHAFADEVRVTCEPSS